jgi:hypothetical protein
MREGEGKPKSDLKWLDRRSTLRTSPKGQNREGAEFVSLNSSGRVRPLAAAISLGNGSYARFLWEMGASLPQRPSWRKSRNGGDCSDLEIVEPYKEPTQAWVPGISRTHWTRGRFSGKSANRGGVSAIASVPYKMAGDHSWAQFTHEIVPGDLNFHGPNRGGLPFLPVADVETHNACAFNHRYEEPRGLQRLGYWVRVGPYVAAKGCDIVFDRGSRCVFVEDNREIYANRIQLSRIEWEMDVGRGIESCWHGKDLIDESEEKRWLSGRLHRLWPWCEEHDGCGWQYMGECFGRMMRSQELMSGDGGEPGPQAIRAVCEWSMSVRGRSWSAMLLCGSG